MNIKNIFGNTDNEKTQIINRIKEICKGYDSRVVDNILDMYKSDIYDSFIDYFYEKDTVNAILHFADYYCRFV